jgi:hypothetical protein
MFEDVNGRVTGEMQRLDGAQHRLIRTLAIGHTYGRSPVAA